MKNIKKIILGVATLFLLIALTEPIEAATKTTPKPTIRVVGGTLLISYPESKKYKKILYKFYFKEKGKWVYKESFPQMINKGKKDENSPYVNALDPFFTREAMKDGEYAVTATIDKMKESKKKIVKVKGVGKNDSKHTYRQFDYRGGAQPYMTLLPVSKKMKNNRKIVVEWVSDYYIYSTWQITVNLYTVDSKGNLKFVENKGLKRYKDENAKHSDEAHFTVKKGQQDYAVAQVNRYGKILGYRFFHSDKKQTRYWALHEGYPTKAMNFKKSDWKYIDGYFPGYN